MPCEKIYKRMKTGHFLDQNFFTALVEWIIDDLQAFNCVENDNIIKINKKKCFFRLFSFKLAKCLKKFYFLRLNISRSIHKSVISLLA